jgi:hypothetical protein
MKRLGELQKTVSAVAPSKHDQIIEDATSNNVAKKECS